MKKIDDALSVIRFSKKVVIFCIAFITIYTMIAIIYQVVTREPLSEVLTDKVFSCILGELGVTGMLKIAESVAEVIQRRNSDTTKTDNLVEEVMEELSEEEILGSMGANSSMYIPYDSRNESATVSETQD